MTFAVAFVAFFDAGKGSYKHTVLGTFHNYFSPQEGSFLWTFYFIPRHFPAPFGAGEDKDHFKKERSYVQANNNQTAVK